MIRPILTGLLGVLSVLTVATVPLSCQSGGVGDPCTPESEYEADFAGFKVSEENIETRSFQCQTRICLVNHFQGRVSCPLGQAAPTACAPGNDTCGDKGKCTEAGTYLVNCNVKADCGDLNCNTTGHYCECGKDADCPQAPSQYFCDGKTHTCKTYVCHKAGDCQTDCNVGDQDCINSNKGKSCCVPGTDVPVATPVCGQCEANSHRSAQDAVYCTCRCGPPSDSSPDEAAADANFNFCDCPTGYECKEVRKNVGLGDALITGQYCVKQDTTYSGENTCGKVAGFFSSELKCQGIGSGAQ